MKIENPIGWCDSTTNIVTGCDKVSPGCKNCYAESGTRARVLRAGGDLKFPNGVETWGPHGQRVPVLGFVPTIRRLNKLCICDVCRAGRVIGIEGNIGGRCGNYVGGCEGKLRRLRLFADSNSDWLDPKWPVETLALFLDEIRLAPNVDVLLLTKRLENWRERLCEVMEFTDRPWQRSDVAERSDFGVWIGGWLEAASPHRGMAETPANVWLGVSVEDKQRKQRLERLRVTPAAVRFASFEPLLEDLRLSRDDVLMLDWAIVGGESGPDSGPHARRDCGVEAILDVAEHCVAAGVPIYVKQDCAFKSGQQGRIPGSVWGIKEFPAPRISRIATNV